jgi:glycosyltransferase involved in cell wall biosynthesis
VITNSEAMKQYLSEWIAPDKVSVAYPVIDVDRVLASRDAPPGHVPFPQADPGLKITVVGRVEDGKGQHRVVDAIGALHARGIAASACFVGSWKEPGYDLRLLERARALGVEDRITLVGEQPDPAPYVTAADVCATPSTLEAFGRTTAEYMALGRAVVASSSGGSAELVAPGETGALVDIEDASSMADAFAAYAADPEMVRAHGAAAPARLATMMGGEHTNDAAIDRLEALVGSDAYRLPEMARYWFELPGAYASLGATSARAAAGLLLSRVRSRSGLVGRVMAAPAVGVRRLIRR